MRTRELKLGVSYRFRERMPRTSPIRATPGGSRRIDSLPAMKVRHTGTLVKVENGIAHMEVDFLSFYENDLGSSKFMNRDRMPKTTVWRSRIIKVKVADVIEPILKEKAA